jgi:urea transport system ATP-binding protein
MDPGSEIGTIEFDGQQIQNTMPYEHARAGIGFVPQGGEIFARLQSCV